MLLWVIIISVALSAAIVQSLQVNLFDNLNFGGKNFALNVYDECVDSPASQFNDRASSLKLESRQDCVQLWENIGCTGRSVIFIGSDDFLSDFNDETSSISSCTFGSTPPVTWKEHWFDHNQNLHRVFYNDDIAVYYDDDVDKSIRWPFQYLTDAWKYTKNTYGFLGKDPRLFAVFHAKKYGGGHPGYHTDSDHDYRNVIDCGSGAQNAWVTGAGNDLDLVTHEIAHIVESVTSNTAGSPAFGKWGDSKWAEIFIYDVYKGLGRAADLQRWYNLMIINKDNFPGNNKYWFRDWFYPMYRDYGGSRVLKNFFAQLSENFPSTNKEAYWKRYDRGMDNYGEFLHFWSGAAGTNLKGLFTKAFGWTSQWESDFRKAQRDFPGVKYSNRNS